MKTPLLVIGNKNYSSWSLRGWLVLRKSGVNFRELRLPLDTPRFAEQVGAWSPTRRVPVLQNGEIQIWDSLAIAEYANEQWAAGLLWPEDIDNRAHARALAAEMHSGFPVLRAAMPMDIRSTGLHVVFRFLSYGVSLPSVAGHYAHTVEQDFDVKEWVKAARAEKEVLLQ